MKVLLLGQGAREHALAKALVGSPRVTSLVAAPGNPGISALGRCVEVDACDPRAVVALARGEGADLVVVGPEAPLVAGVGDALRAAGVAVFGPDAEAARIEGSKAFAKDVMRAAGVPTARCEIFDDAAAAARRAEAWGGPLVVKADGLAAGKGVVVADSGAEAAAACRALGALPAGSRLVLEERLAGPELSVMALCDGERAVLLPPAQDHKRLLDGDRGPNTGGMGAYAPAPLLDAAQLEAVRRTIILPTLAELAARGAPFRGALFAGLMLTADGPKVLEFNCRLGDPETQVILACVAEDLVPVLLECATGALRRERVAARPGVAVGVVLAAQGYPEAPCLGVLIPGLATPPPPGVDRFHAGTRAVGQGCVTAGGRLITVCAHAPTFDEARALVYRDLEVLAFDGAQFRRDIGRPVAVA